MRQNTVTLTIHATTYLPWADGDDQPDVAGTDTSVAEYPREVFADVVLVVADDMGWHLADNGDSRPSHVWYTAPDPEIDVATGELTTKTLHVTGLDDVEAARLRTLVTRTTY